MLHRFVGIFSSWFEDKNYQSRGQKCEEQQPSVIIVLHCLADKIVEGDNSRICTAVDDLNVELCSETPVNQHLVK